MTQDPYALLGIARSASQADIRQAYKRKAKALHPDLHPDDADKLNAFKAVSVAYEILSDPDTRGQYDRGEIDATGQPKGFQAQGFGGPGGFQSGGRAGANGFGSGFQGDPFEDILSGMFGGGRRRPGPQKGADVRYRVDISFADAVNGAVREMTMADGRVLNVTIPAGIETGQTLRLRSQGNRARQAGAPGDALLQVTVRQSDAWHRDKNDIRMTVAVPLGMALLGGHVEIAAPSGPITLKIPAGANAGMVLRLKGKGVQTKGAIGHLLVRLEIVIEDPGDPGLVEWAKRRFSQKQG